MDAVGARRHGPHREHVREVLPQPEAAGRVPGDLSGTRTAATYSGQVAVLPLLTSSGQDDVSTRPRSRTVTTTCTSWGGQVVDRPPGLAAGAGREELVREQHVLPLLEGDRVDQLAPPAGDRGVVGAARPAPGQVPGGEHDVQVEPCIASPRGGRTTIRLRPARVNHPVNRRRIVVLALPDAGRDEGRLGDREDLGAAADVDGDLGALLDLGGDQREADALLEARRERA